MTLPSGLQSLSLGSRFNQCLEGLSLPNLQSLSFGDTFNQPLQGVTLPSLQSLAFGDSFDQNLQGLDLRNLQRLAFGDSCEQRLTGLSLPNLQSLSFGKSYQNLRDLPSPSLQLCYWVVRLQLFWDSPHIFLKSQPKSETCCWGIYSTQGSTSSFFVATWKT